MGSVVVVCASMSVPVFVCVTGLRDIGSGPDSCLLFLTSVLLTAGSGRHKLWRDVMGMEWDGMQHGRHSASRFVAEIRAWGYAVSGLDKVLLMSRTRAPRSISLEVTGMRRRAACCIMHNLQHRKLQVLQGIQVDCRTDRQVNG